MIVAILGDRQTRLPSDWTKETVVAVAAEARFDAAAGAAPRAALTFVGLAGDLVLRVPPGSRVAESGLTLLGDRKVAVTAGDGPEVTVKVYGLFVDVTITDGPA